MSPKPAIIIVTGSFSPVDAYDDTIAPLRAQGYEVIVPALPSIGKKPGPPPTLYDDANLIASEAERFVDDGKDVVLIAHSYGGVVASQAVKGLSKKERESQGKKCGIVRIGYLTALVPDEGKVGGSANDPEMKSSIEVDEVSF
jgi:hypothetical protein